VTGSEGAAGWGSGVAVARGTGARVGIGVGVGPLTWGAPPQAAGSKINRAKLSHMAAVRMMRRCIFGGSSSLTAFGFPA
jgi:hypothetical protein